MKKQKTTIDRVKFCRQATAPLRRDDIMDILVQAGERYHKIRVDLELLSGEHAAIVSHIKSYEDWEYFIDCFSPDGCMCCFDRFNSVQVFKDGDKEIVTLMWQPNHDRHDKNNVVFGNCTFDDIVNIEKIISDRKNHYKNL